MVVQLWRGLLVMIQRHQKAVVRGMLAVVVSAVLQKTGSLGLPVQAEAAVVVVRVLWAFLAKRLRWCLGVGLWCVLADGARLQMTMDIAHTDRPSSEAPIETVSELQARFGVRQLRQQQLGLSFRR